MTKKPQGTLIDFSHGGHIDGTLPADTGEINTRI